MSQNLDLRVNRLPVSTWNHLHMNETDFSLAMPDGPAETVIDNPDKMIHEHSMDFLRDFSQVETGMGPDMNRLLWDGSDGRVQHDVFRLREGKGTVRISFSSEGGHVTGNFIGLEAKADTEMTAVMDMSTADGSECAQAVQTKMIVGRNAKIRLIQIMRAGDEALLLNDVGGICDDNASIDIIHVILSGKNVMLGATVNLNGERSYMTSDTGYMVEGDHRLDMNYVTNHIGPRTNCLMTTNGVLKGTAKKIFRGTIDFRNGSAASKGAVTEDVLLIDDEVVNQTIPVILCAEEDVEGSHGATIGQLDEDTVFYLQSRGMSIEDVYALMEKARLLAVIRKIPDDVTRDALLKDFDAEGENEEE